MANRPPNKEETRALITRLRQQRLQRRRLVALTVLVGLLVVIAVGVALALSGGDPTTSTSGTTTTSQSAAGTTKDPQAESTTSTTPTASGESQDTGRETPATGSGSVATGPGTVTTAPKRPSATVPSESTTTVPAASSVKQAATSGWSDGKTVVIDPGHQGPQDLDYEPIGPGSSTTKYKMSSGATGVATGLAESAVDLQISLKLRDALQARGVQVLMTRTTQDVNISNIERAQIANEAGASLFIRVHCDAFDNSSARGIHVLYPVNRSGWTDDIYAASRRAAQLTQEELVAATGAPDRGLDERDDMTGFNWSDVPVILPELGFMTNPEEDRLLASDSYQQKLAEAMAEAAVRFLRGE